KENERNILSIESFSEATASILGGLVATINMRYNLYFETFFIFISIILACLIVEPNVLKKEKKRSPKQSYNLIKAAFKKNESLKWFIAYSAVISSSTLTFASLIQPYLKHVNLDIAFFGIVWASLRYSVTIFSLFTEKVERTLGEKYSFISFITLVFISYIILSLVNSKLGIAVFFIVYFTRAFNKPILKSHINNLVTSDIRVTTLSIVSFGSRLIFAIIAPFLGYITDTISLSATFYLAGIIHIILGIVPLTFLLKRNSKLKLY
ncbi:MAG: hypothetical protein H7263_15770, partial [Candidatus Sericytochromatia bacterium]|nr:hypothetical protein [Candidatus Sericytochromatia bacterium]